MDRKAELLDIHDMLAELNDGTADYQNLMAQFERVVKNCDKGLGRIWTGMEERNWEKFEVHSTKGYTGKRSGNITIRKGKDGKYDKYVLSIPKSRRKGDCIDLFFSHATNEIGIRFSKDGTFKVSSNGTTSVVRFVRKFDLPSGEYKTTEEGNMLIGKVPENEG
jgi:hypothetical protein